MKNKIFYSFALICAGFVLLAADNTKAQTPRLQASNQQVRTLLNRIVAETVTFKREIQTVVDRGEIDDTNREDRIMDLVADFQDATGTLRSRFTSRQVIGGEVSDVLDKARPINDFITRNQISGRAASRWVPLRNDLSTLSRYYRVSWNWNQPVSTPPVTEAYTATDNQLRNLISQIEDRTNTYKSHINSSLDRSNINNTNTEDSISSYIRKFEDATDRLKERFNSHQSTGADASEVLNRARFIDQFMANNRVDRDATRDWSSLRTDLNTLATYYNVSWNWNQQLPGNTGNIFPNRDRNFDARITGTYRLNASRSDNVSDVLDRSVGSYTVDQRDNMRRNLERRLTAPEMIAIEKNNRTVRIASSNSPQVSFEADGIAKTETNDRGRTITTTATADINGITINYQGDRISDFYVTFSPGANGQLNVTRRIYLENRNETVTVASVYDKVDSSAQWSTVNNGTTTGINPIGANDFYIPNGTRITASLRETVSTKASQVGDRFAMEVTSPSQYRGAVIEGKVAQAANSGRISGRANVSLEFDTITISGRSYRFAGIIESVNAANGDTVTVNNEGTVRDSSQTTTTATRAGIGAVLGAIIGAIAGGGQGAAIGAGVGAGAGAGSVLITGRDTIELGPGSTFNITATAPANTGITRN